MAEDLSLAALRGWIGREEQAEDVVTPALAARFVATLMPDLPAPDEGAPVPRLLHFCLCQPAPPMAGLGDDGHPARGGFLPPVPLPRRMWAGSRIVFHGDLRVGDHVTRRSRIADIAVKEGRSGALCFVTVDHALRVGLELRVEDRQSIVYRAAARGPAPTAGEPAARGETVEAVEATPTLLFRYSALTFNSHRIHYDRAYATLAEGYAGLVVHGPLQATLLCRLADRIVGRWPDRFEYRGQSPILDGATVELHAGALADGAMALWTATPGGPVATLAEARWN